MINRMSAGRSRERQKSEYSSLEVTLQSLIDIKLSLMKEKNSLQNEIEEFKYKSKLVTL